MGLSGGNRKAFFLEEEVIRRYRRWLVGTVAVGLGILLAISGAEAQQKAVNLTWTAGPVGDGWYLIAGGIALLIRDTTGINVKVVSGGGRFHERFDPEPLGEAR